MNKIRPFVSPRNLLVFNFILLIVFLIFSCTTEDDGAFDAAMDIESVLAPLPEYIPVPEDNELTDARIDLGRQLFWDPILSGNRDVACATCHHPDKGYADALDLSIGVGGSGLGEQRSGSIIAKRNAHTVVNTAFNGITTESVVTPSNAPMFWDNRAMNLEEQSLLPLLSAEEMRGNQIPQAAMHDTIVQRLDNLPTYKLAFQEAYGSDAISIDRVAQAIASFERTLVAWNSPFDRYMRGDATAMTQQQIDGMNAFVNIGCAECHSGPMFSDYELHTLGVPDNPKLPNTDSARGDYAFRTPTLRNLALTAPYMHNGVQGSLQEVMEFYEELSEGEDNAINDNLTIGDIAPLARQLDMDDDAISNAIIAFMDALNDPNFDTSIPASVPSGLPVGGNIGN